MTKIVSLIVLTFFVFHLFGQTDNEHQNRQTDNSTISKCIDSLEFKVGEFYYGLDPLEIVQIMGNPDSIIEEPDTNSENWIFSDISFGILNDHVYYISTKSENYSTPSGIKAGLNISDISKILNRDLYQLIDNNEVQFVNCAYEVYFIFKFTELKELEKLEIGIDLP